MMSRLYLGKWDKEAIHQLKIPEKTFRTRGNSGGRYCVSLRSYTLRMAGNCTTGCCRDAALVFFVEGASFGAGSDVGSHQGYSKLFLHSIRVLSGASGNTVLVRVKQLGSRATANSRGRWV